VTRTNEQEVINLSFPASVDFVVLARFTTAAVAARSGFDMDEIEDLRLAIDELCVAFGPMEQFENIHFEFLRHEETIRITCTFQSSGKIEPAVSDDPAIVDWERTGELSQLLLDALVDQHGQQDRDGHPCAWMEKRSGVKPRP